MDGTSSLNGKDIAIDEQANLVDSVLATGTPMNSSNSPLRHGRSLPLPLRIKTGSIGDEKFVAENHKEHHEIPWEQVKMVCLGMIAERQETEVAAYVTEKVISDMGRSIKGGRSADDGRIVSFRETQVLDVFVEGFSEPLRFESGIINYRAFLGKISFVSFQNFFKFVHTFVSHCKESRFNENVKKFLSWQRYDLQSWPSFDEYNADLSRYMAILDKLLRYEDLDLSRTSWAQEWTD